MSKLVQILSRSFPALSIACSKSLVLPLSTFSRSVTRPLSTLGDRLKSKEHVEEELYMHRQEKEQLQNLREKLQACQHLRKQLYEEVALENAMEDIRFVLGPKEEISPEGLKRLAEWKVFGKPQ